eukprot:1080220-Prymnesium_polylepis.1
MDTQAVFRDSTVRENERTSDVVQPKDSECLGKSVIFPQTRAGEALAACGRSVRPWKDMQ